MYEVAISAAAETQQPELCASMFELFLRDCVREGWEPAQPTMLEALVRTCKVGAILEDSLCIISKPEQRSTLITGLLAASATVGNADWEVATLAQAASMLRPSNLAEAVMRAQACLNLIHAPPSASACAAPSDVKAAVVAALQDLLYAPRGSLNLELLGLPSSTRDALVLALLGTGTSNAPRAQLRSLVILLLNLAPAYDGVGVQALTCQHAIAAAAATQQHERCAFVFKLFLRTCKRNGWEPTRPAMLKDLVRTCDAGTIVEDSLGILSKPEQRSALITGLLVASARVGNAGWAVATLAQAATMPCPSSLADAVPLVQACVDLLDAPPSGFASVPASGVAAAAAPALQAAFYASGGSPNLELLHGLPSSTRDALVRTLLSTGSDVASLALLRPLVLDLSPSQHEAEQLLSDCHLLSTSPHLLRKMASPSPPYLDRPTGGDQPQLLVSFLEEHVAGSPSSPGAAGDDSSSGGGSRALLASIQQADWRCLVSGMLDMCKGDKAITRATTRIVEMALAASARPQAGGNVEARLVAETRWVVMEAMFAPKKLRHAAAVGVARNLLLGLQGHGWYLHASACRGQGVAADDGTQAEVVHECAGLLAGLGRERSLTSDRAEAVAVRDSLPPCITDLCASLAQLGGRWANITCSQAGGDAAQALLFAAEACHKRCDVPLVDLLCAHLSSVSKEVPTRLAELVLEAVADLEVLDLGAPLLRALRLEPDRWGSDRAAEVAREQLLELPTAERCAALCLLLSAAPTWPGIEPGTAARALVEVAELLPMCAADGDLRTMQPLVLAAYREAAALAASLAAATQSDSTGADAQHLHLDPRQLYAAAARSAGVAVSGSSAGATSVPPSVSTVLDLLAVCNTAQLPLEAVQLALSVLDGKQPLDRSSSSSSSGEVGGELEPAPPLDEQCVAAEAMAIANGARFFHSSLTVFLALLRRRGTSGVDSAGAMQMVLDAINDPSASQDEQGRLLSELIDERIGAVSEEGYYAMEEAAAGGHASCAIVARYVWLARMRGHQWRLPSSWTVPAVAESSAVEEHPLDSSASGDDDGGGVSNSVGIERVAYYGGKEMTAVDRQLMERLHPGSAIVWCESGGTGGRAPAQFLCKSIRRGAFDCVYIETRWAGHGDVGKVVQACRQWCVPFQQVSPHVKCKLKAEARPQQHG
ncbi:hypothetical protein FOA52_010659 [Chlamydomonas sp. UWO 241]|nr:hypothetical protein FOA52_010659 [Chlamydomonas sp. UWO 241]